MKLKSLPIMEKKFIAKNGKTVLVCNDKGKRLEVWVNGNQEDNPGLLANVQVNEVGDTFVASKDSSRMVDHPTEKDIKDPTKAKQVPAYLKGQTVSRLAESVEFRGFAGANAPTQFAQAADAFGLQLQVVLSAA